MDIDSDLSNAEKRFGVRDIVIEYVSKKYGKDAICGITTPSTLAAKAAIDNVQRVLMSKQMAEKPDQKDALKKYWYDLAADMKALIPADPGTTFHTKVDEDKTVKDVILEVYGQNKDAQELLILAMQLEGININYGKHAAGVIIADNGDTFKFTNQIILFI